MGVRVTFNILLPMLYLYLHSIYFVSRNPEFVSFFWTFYWSTTESKLCFKSAVLTMCYLDKDWVVGKQTSTWVCSISVSFFSLTLSLFLCNTGLAFISLKDQLIWNQTSALFILPWSRARNPTLSLALALFWLITHLLFHFNIDLPKFASLVYDVYKHIYKQFVFSCFSEVCLRHRQWSEGLGFWHCSLHTYWILS